MTEKKTNRSKVVTFRLSPGEYEQISKRYKTTTCRKLSDYMRQMLFYGKVTILTRDKSLDDFMAEMMLLRNELNAIGNNFNQEVHKLHTLQKIPDFHIWLITNQKLHKEVSGKIDSIKIRIEKFSDQWLR